MTQVKIGGKKVHIRCKNVDQRIPVWLKGIAIEPEILREVRQVFSTQVATVTKRDKEK